MLSAIPVRAAQDSGFENGLRLGAAMPAGNVDSERPLADDVAVRFPVWVDIGYRLNPVVYLALFAQVGIDRAASACTDHVTDALRCTVEDVRLGFEGLAHLTPNTPLDWWLGAGIGWERLEQRTPYNTGDTGLNSVKVVDEYHQGPALDLQAGLDFTVAGDLRVGPFVAYTLGTYLDESCPADKCNKAGDNALHHWFTLGMRGTFGP